MDRVDLDVATEFLLIAATLVELKARRLLPGPRRPSSTRSCCASRSATCSSPGCSSARRSRTRRGARHAARRRPRSRSRAPPVPRSRSARWRRTRSSGSPLDVVPRRGASAASRPRSSRRSHRPRRADPRQRARRGRGGARAAADDGPMSFRDLASGAGDKLEVIVRFLAVLELYKQGVVDLEQVETFGDLMVRPLASGERVALDLASLDDWGDEPAIDLNEADRDRSRRRHRGASVRLDERARGARPRSKRSCMAAIEPVEPQLLAQLVEIAGRRGRGALRRARRRVRARRARASRSAASPAATASRRTPTPPYVERFVLDGQTARLSGPALETLAIVAYKQPVSRAQLSAIRGVNVESTLKTLVAARLRRGESATTPAPGKPILYGTTTLFLERLGLDSLDRAAAARRLRARARRSSRRSSAACSCATTRSPMPRRTRPATPKPRLRPIPTRRRSPRSCSPASTPSDRGRASGCRRSSRAPASGRAASCEELIAAGRVDGRRRGRGPRPRGSTRDRDRIDARRRAGRRRHRRSSTTCSTSRRGYVTTARDPQGRPTVVELVPTEPRVFPVGRLDCDTEGLLLLTNDGELTQLLTHPSHGVEKEYLAEVEGVPTRGALRRLREGVELDDGPTAPARGASRAGRERRPARAVEIVHPRGSQPQVRRMCEAVGHPVRRLVRTRIGPLARPDARAGRVAGAHGRRGAGALRAAPVRSPSRRGRAVRGTRRAPGSLASRESPGAARRDHVRRGHEGGDRRQDPGAGAGDARAQRRRPRRPRQHHLHRHRRPHRRVPGDRGPGARARRRPAALRPGARHRGRHAAVRSAC